MQDVDGTRSCVVVVRDADQNRAAFDQIERAPHGLAGMVGEAEDELPPTLEDVGTTAAVLSLNLLHGHLRSKAIGGARITRAKGTMDGGWRVSREPEATLASAADEATGAIVFESLVELRFGVHDEGASASDRLTDGLRRNEEQPRSLTGRGCDERCTLPQHGKLT